MELNDGELDDWSCQIDNLSDLGDRGLVKRTVKLLLDTYQGCKIQFVFPLLSVTNKQNKTMNKITLLGI